MASCYTDSHERKIKADEPGAVELTELESSKLFNDDYIKLSIDTFRNSLMVKLTVNTNKKEFPFPTDKGTKLSGTAFRFELFHNGQPVQGAGLPVYARNNRIFYTYGYNQWLGESLDYYSDTIDLQLQPSVTFEIPFYAFNKIKAGINEFELKVAQKVFCAPTGKLEFRPDSTGRDSVMTFDRCVQPLELLKTKVKFKLNIPAMYKTAFINELIELRDDSVYSPAGSDNTIWNSSYPDMYWTINHPAKMNYARSDYQKSTASYDRADTFYIYHYGAKDTIEIGVWDHDNLSKDDYIAHKRFLMDQFRLNKSNRFRFNAVRRMEIKTISYGVINK
jgi:hypothetical protein